MFAIDSPTRRQFLSLGGGLSLAALGCGQEAGTGRSAADLTVRIGEITLDLGPRRSVKTLAYNGQVPGPVLRAAEGKPILVDVINESKDSELVHWHGFHIPSEVDGAHEEGTPHIPARGQARYTITPSPAGTRWYHSHGDAGRDLDKSTYTGQFGIFVVEPRGDPARYDLEIPILLHEWEGFWDRDGPMEVAYKLFSVNGKMLGAGEPVRVRAGQRALFRIVNASATLIHRLALPGHVFRVVALDGNDVPTPQSVRALELGPGERIDAVVEMKNPGVWVLGSPNDKWRAAGMGIVIEYADATGAPRWAPVPAPPWDYTIFGDPRAVAAGPDARVPLVFKEAGSGHRWMINGKSFPKTDPIRVKAGRRYRLIFDNQSADAHPVHLHRHRFELVRVADTATAGVMKDVVIVPAWKTVEVDVVASNPGPTLFHCHQQFHMDQGFKAMLLYEG
jgi:FtsP/CotA-like multicopper oxidase with cupredoxin domain